MSAEKLPDFLGLTPQKVAENARLVLSFFDARPAVTLNVPLNHPVLHALFDGKSFDQNSVKNFIAARLDSAENAQEFLDELPLCSVASKPSP